MPGGSLGLRTASYGSLQQQHVQKSLALSIQCTPVSTRKAREKEKLLLRVCKIVGRRSVGMVVVAVLSVVVLVSVFSVINKDDVSKDPDTIWQSKHSFPGLKSTSVASGPPLMSLNGGHKLNMSVVSHISSPSKESAVQDNVLVVNRSTLSSVRYCENFAFSPPPPPADRRRSGPRPCEVCYLPVEHAAAHMPSSPSVSPVLKNLTYFSEGNSYTNDSNGGSAFGGHQSFQQRNDSFNIKESMSVHCGFFQGTKPGTGSGFDIDEADLIEMAKCYGIVVASAIFGNYDIAQQPKNTSELAKRNTCFYMFVDEETKAYMKNSSALDNSNDRVGLWRLVTVRELPYIDPRRNGKIPKLLLHRLFPNARYSIWVDGKLELVVDPYQILERFLWRKNATFAISRHYRRFDVFVEAEANKAAGKYDNASIDRQIEFYKNEGLTRYSRAKLPITSDVPEGCVIIREHMPITNLFTCLWFNEVDRFTSRDQISFSTVRDKIMSRVNWNASMFLDCERRNFVVQVYHRDLLERRRLSRPPSSPPLPVRTIRPSRKILPGYVPSMPVKTPARPFRRIRDRKSTSRRHRSKSTTRKDNN